MLHQSICRFPKAILEMTLSCEEKHSAVKFYMMNSYCCAYDTGININSNEVEMYLSLLMVEMRPDIR